MECLLLRNHRILDAQVEKLVYSQVCLLIQIIDEMESQKNCFLVLSMKLSNMDAEQYKSQLQIWELNFTLTLVLSITVILCNINFDVNSSLFNSIIKYLCKYSQAKSLAVFLYPKGGLIKMKTYIYPENLRANVKLWFWSVRDFIIICGGIILSVVILVNFWNVLPFAATACFAFLSLRVDETSIIDYIFNAVKFFLTSQQLYLWRKI